MPRLTIDNQAVEVPAGATLLVAARTLGLDIPALCHRDGCRPQNACMLCLVRDAATGRLVPACSTSAAEGQRIESETPEIRSLRRTGLELLLSNHLGDCSAPCESACPLHLNVPEMLGQVAVGQMRQAIAAIRREMALPAVLGYVCSHPCENACRRGQLDAAAAICRVQQHVAEADLTAGTMILPEMTVASGRRVAVVGAGPTGLSAAYHLRIAGHACTVFEARERPGGRLRTEFAAEQLPPAVLDGEIELVARMGVEFRTSTALGTHVSLDEVRGQFDAVLLATGAGTATLESPAVPGVFAAGRAVRPTLAVVRSMAEGKSAAAMIDAFLRGQAREAGRPFTVRAGRLKAEQLVQLGSLAGAAGRLDEGQPGSDALIRQEAERCLHCDCGKRDGCRLKHYAAAYGASPTRYGPVHRPLERHGRPGGLVYEPGKCILCGLCVEIATAAGEPLGLAFIGRGFDVRVAVPFDGLLEEALRTAARACAEACPSGALTLGQNDE